MPPAGSSAQARDRLVEVLEPLVRAAGYDLEDIAVSAAGRRSVVRVTVDADGGIDLDAVAEVSRIVSEALDEQAQTGVLAGAYVLEVSSPGTDRPLREPRHWRRNVGRLVTVAVDGAQRAARITGVTDDAVVLSADGRDEPVAWDRLGAGRVQLEFDHADGEDR